MAKSSTKTADAAGDAAEKSENGAATTEQPSLNALAQYIKDFSFENPRAPASLQAQSESPNINIGVNVNANPLNDNDYEVMLKIEADAKTGEEVLFSAELLYAGVFRITGVPKENIHPIVLIECPRLLFPFARQILAEGTRNGGFPPLMIDPVDFAGLYRQRIAEAQAEAAKEKKS
ncbi:MAG: protein-export chaperone SecB [Pseudomonadota bacterium]